MPGATLEDLMQQVNSYKAGASAGASQLTDLFTKQSAIEQQNAALLTQSGIDSSTIEAAKQAALLQTQARISKTADIFGTDVTAQNEQLSGLAAVSKAAYEKKQELADIIAQKESTSVFENPLEYLMNKFTINSDIAAHNAANATLQNSQARIQELNAETQSTVATQKMLETGVTVASAAAATRDAATKANIDANKSRIIGLGYGVQGIEAALNANKEQLAATNMAFNGTQQAIHTQIAQAGLALSQAAAAERIREFNMRMKDSQDQEAIGKHMLDTINIGRQMRGLGALDDINGKMAIRALTGKGGVLNADMQADWESGERHSVTGLNTIAANPAQFAQRVNSGSPLNLTPAQAPIKGIVQQAINLVSAAGKNPLGPEATANPALKSVDLKDKGNVVAAINSTAQSIINNQAANVNPKDGDNVFNIPSMNTLAANSSTLQATPLYQKVFKPLMDQGVQLTDPKQIFDAVAAAAAKGIITHAQALDLTTFYHVGVSVNKAQRNLEGVAGLVFQNSYNTKVTTNPTGLMNTDSIVNLTDPGQVSAALLKVQAQRLAVQMSEGAASMRKGGTNTNNLDLFNSPNALHINSKPAQNMTEAERSKLVAPFFIKGNQ